MKKILAVLLSAMLVMTVFLTPYVIAEAVEPPASPGAPVPVAFTVNLTGLIIAILVAFFEFLLAWLLKAVIPPLKKWLNSHTTKNQQAILWNVITRLVEAAEQTITGINCGSEKMQFVKDALRRRGFEVDTYLIEAAVKEMNDRVIGEIAHELNIETEVEYDDSDDDTDAEPVEDDETE